MRIFIAEIKWADGGIVPLLFAEYPSWEEISTAVDAFRPDWPKMHPGWALLCVRRTTEIPIGSTMHSPPPEL